MESVNADFKARVYAVVSLIPEGRLMTYGQIAAICGSPRAARIVGGLAHLASCAHLPACGTGPQPTDVVASRELCPMHDLNWQRVVKKDGSLAEGYPGGIEGHRQALATEGIETDQGLKVDIRRLQWSPS